MASRTFLVHSLEITGRGLPVDMSQRIVQSSKWTLSKERPVMEVLYAVISSEAD